MKRSWSAREWLPKSAATLTLIGVTTTPEGVVVEADGPSSARCPACRRRSHSRHSRYWRTLKDLAAQGRSVTLRVHVSRWRCGHRRCETAIFADRLTGVSAPRVQHTHRFGAVGHLVGHALGGRGGERLLARLGMAISDGTILRLLTRPVAAPPAPEVLRVVGLDDWAWQKGQHHYGTILVDLERRQVVDVLPVRTADAVAAWLAAHPDIVIISRDRHGPYAQAVRRGAPQATQVADRFHLVLNLRGAVQQELSRLRPFLGVSYALAAAATTACEPVVIAPPRRASVVVDDQHQVLQQRRALHLDRFQLVKRLQAAGHTASTIMRETGFGRASVRKWVHLNDLPTRNRMAPRAGMPEFYREYLWGRWTAGCQSGRLLMTEIQARGYVGCYAGLAKLLAPWRAPAPVRTDTPIDHAPIASEAPIAGDDVIASGPVRHISPQIAAALLSQPRPLLSARQAETVDALKEQCPGFTTMRRLVLSFRTILRVGTVATLHDWLTRATATNIHALQRFVRTLRKDLQAVEGAVTESWSNGPVEGHINRLKTLRRQMYGRAGVALLRARMLPLPPLFLR
jgi:transposase